MRTALISLILASGFFASAPSAARPPGQVDPGPVAVADEPVTFPVPAVDPGPAPPVVPDPAPPMPPPATRPPVPAKSTTAACACSCGCPRCACPTDGARAVRQPAPTAPARIYRTDNMGQVWHDTDPANLDRWVAFRNSQRIVATYVQSPSSRPMYTQSASSPQFPVLYQGFGNGPIFGGGLSAGACAGGSCR